MSKLWGGRFSEETEKIVNEFSSSLHLDKRMWSVDIEGSLAHATMLMRQNIISKDDGEQIHRGLKEVRDELFASFQKGCDPFLNSQAEDIHSEIEQRLHAKLGAVAGKLHTARSRNDQVATDLRLYLREQIIELDQDLQKLQSWIVATAESHMQSILPGLTHMQHGQPVSLAHHLMAYFWMFQRDRLRLKNTFKGVNVLPLGSAALAGTSFPIDRAWVSQELQFDSVSENSLDAVSDRDFAVEFLSTASTIMMHLSRWSEEVVLWSMPEFQFIELSDSVTTGSSIMPQKKNPDVSELIRARTGRVNGALMGLLTVLKALPLSYQRDLQEDKHHLFEALDSVRICVKLMFCQMQKAQFKTDKMAQSVAGDASNATDLADFLAVKGMPFREAHEVVGRIVRFSLESKIALEEMTLAQLKEFSTLFDESTLDALKPLNVMKARNSEGGTSPTAVKIQIEKAKQALQIHL